MLKWKQISDEMMAYCELKEDSIFSKIENMEFYIKESFAIAEKAARQYKDKDLFAILQKHHVQICYHDDTGESEMMFSKVQSQIYYEKDCRVIDIFLPCIREKMDALKQYGYQISFEELLAIHMAHEFYHFYEYEYDKRTYEMLPKVDYRMMHVISRKAAVHRSSEIAAHRFAQIITKAPLHPKLMDYMYLIKKGIYQENDVFQIVNKAEKALLGGTK